MHEIAQESAADEPSTARLAQWRTGVTGFRLAPLIALLARFGRGVAHEIYQDRWLYVLVGLYTAGVGLIAARLGLQDRFAPLLYVGAWLTAAIGILIPGAFVFAAASGVIERPRAPLHGFLRELARAFHPRVPAGLLLFCATVVFYGAFTSMKNMLPQLSAFEWDVWLADLDQSLHGGYDPVRASMRLIGAIPTGAIDLIYGKGWILLMLGVSIWAATSSRFAHLRRPYFLTLFFCWMLIGNVLAGLFLSGGPIYYGVFTGDHLRFAGLEESLAGTESLFHTKYLLDLSSATTTKLGAGISAFPSMHISIATLLALFLWSIDRRLGFLGVLFAFAILVGSVRLGWHYAIDGYVSIIITALAWRAFSWLDRRRVVAAGEHP